MPAVAAMLARRIEPTRLPLQETVQDLTSCLSVAFFSSTAAVTSAVLPVKSSAPVTRVIIRPKGRPG